MPFKIVQTKEDGKITPSLTVVPSAWESFGVLFWPPKRVKNGNKLIRDPNSKPEPDWQKYTCIKKRDNFILYESAESEIAAMTYNTDSDGSVAINRPRKLCPKLNNPRKIIGRVPQVSFNSLAESSYISDINNSQNTVVEPPEKATEEQLLQKVNLKSPTSNEARNLMPKVQILQSVPIASAKGQISPVEIEFPYGTPTNLLFRSNSEEQTEVLEVENDCENIESYENTITNSSNSSIIQNQKIIISNQKKIVDELAKVKTMLDLFLENQTMSDNVTILKENPPNQNESPWKTLLPINSFEKLEEVELNLSNKKLQQILVDEKSLVYGTSGKRNGQSCCYSVVDHFFQRNFLITCSWAGGSRDNDRKISFKSYNQIIKTFFKIIHLADNEFSLTDCQNFFKCVIKNAKRRAFNLENPKRKRSSASKSRPTNLKYKKMIPENKENIPQETETNEGESDNDEMEMTEEMTDYDDHEISNAESD